MDVRTVGEHESGTDISKLKSLYQKYSEKGLEIISILQGWDRVYLNKFSQEHNLPWIECYEEDTPWSPIYDIFGINSTPTIWLLDREGRLVDMYPEEHLEEGIVKLL